MQAHGQEVEKVRIEMITSQDLVHILTHTDSGFKEIIKSSLKLKEEGVRKLKVLQEGTFSEGINFLQKNSDLLKTPIILEGDKVLIGFNSEEIRIFLSKSYRKQVLSKNF